MRFVENHAMYTATFIFAKGRFDDEFHRIDQEIADMARAAPGYLGQEAWENPASGLVSNVCYWASLEALQALIDHPRHREAKARQGQWLAGYQVGISKVLRMDGDSKLEGLLPVTSASP